MLPSSLLLTLITKDCVFHWSKKSSSTSLLLLFKTQTVHVIKTVICRFHSSSFSQSVQIRLLFNLHSEPLPTAPSFFLYIFPHWFTFRFTISSQSTAASFSLSLYCNHSCCNIIFYFHEHLCKRHVFLSS